MTSGAAARQAYRGLMSEPNAFAEERQRRIAAYVASRGRVVVGELTELTGVTGTTIRKDLTVLSRSGLVRRTHGGAIAVRPLVEPLLERREAVNLPAKEAIARACLELVEDGTSIYLDSGTTLLRLAEQLSGRTVNVLTNAVGVAQVLAETLGARHTLLGGQFRPGAGCFVGPLARASLRRFTVNIAFIGASGVSAEGVTEADLHEAELKAEVIDRARRVVVAVDSSKIGLVDFALVCPLDKVDVVITDSEDHDFAQACAEHGVEIRVVLLDETPVQRDGI